MRGAAWERLPTQGTLAVSSSSRVGRAGTAARTTSTTPNLGHRKRDRAKQQKHGTYAEAHCEITD